MKTMLTTGEVAQFCGVNHRTVHRWIRDGRLKAFSLPGRGDHRVPVNACIAFFREYDIPVPPQLEKWSNTAPEIIEGDLKVLIIEDDERVVRYLTRLLEGHDASIEIRVAQDGFKAGLEMGTYHPHLILLDLKLPYVDGFEVLEIIRSTPAMEGVKIVAISSYGEELLEKAVKAGADASLQKPISKDTLISLLRQAFPSHFAAPAVT